VQPNSQYELFVYNSNTGLSEQFTVNVIETGRRPRVEIYLSTKNADLVSGLNQFKNNYSTLSKKTVEIDCDINNSKCDSRALGTNWLDVQSYTRGHEKVVADLNGWSGIFIAFRMKVGTFSYIVKVNFDNGDILTLSLINAYSDVGFKVVSLEDKNGKDITSSYVNYIKQVSNYSENSPVLTFRGYDIYFDWSDHVGCGNYECKVIITDP